MYAKLQHPLKIIVEIVQRIGPFLQSQVAALWSLGSAVMDWQAKVQAELAEALHYKLPLTQASPATLELTCGLRCNLVPYSQVPSDL